MTSTDLLVSITWLEFLEKGPIEVYVGTALCRCFREREKGLPDMKKTHYSCGLDVVLELIEGKWKFLVLWHLASGPKRFGELRRLVGGVSEKMLIQELKEMVADNITLRQDFKEVPPKVIYSLTEEGMALAEACEPLCMLGTEIANREGLTLGSDTFLVIPIDR